MASPKKKRSISIKKLLKFSGIMLVCIYASFILIKQQMTLSAIEDTQAERSAAISSRNAENQALQDELKKAEAVNEYMKHTIAENEKEKESAENKDNRISEKQTDTNSRLTTAEDEYIEQLIRERLGYVKPNERIFIDISRDK